MYLKAGLASPSGPFVPRIGCVLRTSGTRLPIDGKKLFLVGVLFDVYQSAGGNNGEGPCRLPWLAVVDEKGQRRAGSGRLQTVGEISQCSSAGQTEQGEI